MIILIILLLLPYFTLSNDEIPINQGLPAEEPTTNDAPLSQSTDYTPPVVNLNSQPEEKSSFAAFGLDVAAMAKEALNDPHKVNPVLRDFAMLVKGLPETPDTKKNLLVMADMAKQRAKQSESPTNESASNAQTACNSLDGTKIEEPTPNERQIFSMPESSQSASTKTSNGQSDSEKPNATVHIRTPEYDMSTVFPFDRNLQMVAARTTVNFLRTQKNIRGCALVAPQEHEIFKDVAKDVPWELCNHIFIDVKYKRLKKDKFKFELDQKLHRIAKEIKYEHPEMKIVVKLLPESDADIHCMVIGDAETRETTRDLFSSDTMDWIQRTNLRMDQKEKEEYLTDRGKLINDTGRAIRFDGVMLQYANIHPKDTQVTHGQTNYFSDLVHIFRNHINKRKFSLQLHVKFMAFDDLHPEMNLGFINGFVDYIFLDSTLLIPYSFETSAETNLIAALEHLKFAGLNSKKLYVGLPVIATEHQLHSEVNAGSTEMKNLLNKAHSSTYRASTPKTIPYTTYCELEESVGMHAKRKPGATSVYLGNSFHDLEEKIDFVIKYGLTGVYMDLSWEIIKQLAQKSLTGIKKELKCEILSQIQSESSRKVTPSTNTVTKNPGQNIETISKQNKTIEVSKTTNSPIDCSLRTVMDLINCRFLGNQEHTNKINEKTLLAQSKLCYIMFQRAGTAIGDSKNKGMTCALAPKTSLVTTAHFSSKSTDHQTTV